MVASVIGEVTSARESTDREGENGRLIREYRRTFLVATTSQNDDARVVKNAVGIPKRYFPYVSSVTTDNNAKCISINARQRGGNPYAWEVECLWTTQPGRQIGNQPEEESPPSPLEEPPDIEFGDETRTVPATRVYDGSTLETNVFVLASNGEPYDPPPEIEDGLSTLVISRNEESYNPSIASTYRKTTNAETFWGFSAGQVFCRSITARLQWSNGVGFWRVTYTFLIDPRGHNARPLNQGTYYLDSGDRKTFLDNDGNRYVGLLNSSGGQASASGATFGNFQVYPRVSWTPLSLPDLS